MDTGMIFLHVGLHRKNQRVCKALFLQLIKKVKAAPKAAFYLFFLEQGVPVGYPFFWLKNNQISKVGVK